MEIPDVNLDAIADPATRQALAQLLNLIETLVAENRTLRTENQHLRDELARLKGGSGKPDIKPPSPAPDHSSETQRRSLKPRQKGRKLPILMPTRTQRCVVEPSTLPPDAIRHGTTEVLVQDLLLQPEVIRFVREVYFIPSTAQTITAPLPAGYQGAFGPHIQALALSLAYDAQISQPALLRFFQDAGIQIGAGTIARWLSDAQQHWRQEATDIHHAGLASGPWQATDQTATRVEGQNETCHVLGNHLFTVYQTRPGGTRQDVLAVLWGREPQYRLNTDALDWLGPTSLSATLLLRLQAALPWEVTLSASQLCSHLTLAGISLGPQQRQQVWDALAVAAYHAQTDVPIIGQLLSDGAAVYDLIVDEHGLCWVHDWRHYAKLSPVVPTHQQALARFGTDYWTFYRALMAYRRTPSSAERDRLRTRFTELFTQRTGYAALDERISKTWHNREQLLLVLDHPEIPLHNNDMELAARRRVRKRDVSFGPQSRNGARAWDTFQTMIATASKLGVRVYAYFRDRLLAPNTTPSLADHIRARTATSPSPIPA